MITKCMEYVIAVVGFINKINNEWMNHYNIINKSVAELDIYSNRQ